MCEAVNTISDVAQGKATGAGQMPYEGPGELASALDDFDVSFILKKEALVTAKVIGT